MPWLRQIFMIDAVSTHRLMMPRRFRTLFISDIHLGASTGLLSAIPHLCAVIGMSLFGVSSDRRNERRGHLMLATLLAATGWSLAAWSPTPVVAFFGLCIAQTGMMSMLPIFWTLGHQLASVKRTLAGELQRIVAQCQWSVDARQQAVIIIHSRLL